MPLAAATEVVGWPEETVSAKMFWPFGSRPLGFTKLASCNCPRFCGVVLPGTSTVTVPSVPMVRPVELVGTVMPGCTR
jgi:hypothetical protein